MRGRHPEGHITYYRNKGMEETGKEREECRRLLREARAEKGI
jgi:hypothetical protein